MPFTLQQSGISGDAIWLHHRRNGELLGWSRKASDDSGKGMFQHFDTQGELRGDSPTMDEWSNFIDAQEDDIDNVIPPASGPTPAIQSTTPATPKGRGTGFSRLIIGIFILLLAALGFIITKQNARNPLAASDGGRVTVPSASSPKISESSSLSTITENNSVSKDYGTKKSTASVSKNPDLTPDAVKKITDQAILATIAREAKDISVRQAAVEKLTDQALLAKIAVQEKDDYVRYTAVKKLDQTSLAKIGMWVKPELTKQVTDLELLRKIAIEAKDHQVRRAAVEKFTDQALLAKVAVDDSFPDLRRYAVEKLTDQALLTKIAAQDKDPHVRVSASLRLNNLSELNRSYTSESNERKQVENRSEVEQAAAGLAQASWHALEKLSGYLVNVGINQRLIEIASQRGDAEKVTLYRSYEESNRQNVQDAAAAYAQSMTGLYRLPLAVRQKAVEDVQMEIATLGGSAWRATLARRMASDMRNLPDFKQTIWMDEIRQIREQKQQPTNPP